MRSVKHAVLHLQWYSSDAMLLNSSNYEYHKQPNSIRLSWWWILRSAAINPDADLQMLSHCCALWSRQHKQPEALCTDQLLPDPTPPPAWTLVQNKVVQGRFRGGLGQGSGWTEAVHWQEGEDLSSNNVHQDPIPPSQSRLTPYISCYRSNAIRAGISPRWPTFWRNPSERHLLTFPGLLVPPSPSVSGAACSGLAAYRIAGKGGKIEPEVHILTYS